MNMFEKISAVSLNSAPCFETQGEWSAGYNLAKNSGDGVTVGPGDENLNVFVQSFAVDSQKYFMLVARARSASGQSEKAIIQVNWLTADKQFIQATQKYFEIDDREITTAMYRAKVPDGAEIGVIYVVPGSKDGQVHYYEMGLYPDSGLKPILNTLHHSERADWPYWGKLTRGIELARNLVCKNRASADRPEKFWENFGKNKPVCFVHIPKTAGHSIYSLLEKNYPKDSLVMPYSGVEGNIHTILNLTPREMERTRVIAAHMPFGVHSYIGECDYLTFLRDPLDMAVSGYYFNMENPGAPGHGKEIGLNRTLLQYAECNDNVMTRFLISSAFSEATFWLSGEINPNVKGVSYLGLDCAAEVAVRTVALQQWNFNYCPTRFPAPGAMERVAVECSNDNFESDVRLVAELHLKQDRELHSYGIPGAAQGRFWRVRALSSPQTARWGVVALRFFEQEASTIPSANYGHLAVSGKPLCSSAADSYPASNAFNGHDRLAQHQVPPNAIEMYHFKEAANNLRERFLVGLLERYDQSIGMMGKVLDWSYLANEKRNAGTIRRDANILTDYEKKQLEEINRYDLLLYQYAQRLFQSDLKKLQIQR